jgi:hypothetical protein
MKAGEKMSQQQYKVVLSSNLDKTSVAMMDVHHLSKMERMQRAGKRAGLFFGAAVFCVFIPIAHFILVPTFLGLTVYSLYAMSKKHYAIIDGKITCPNCSKEIIAPHNSFNWPLHSTCDGCQMQIRVEQL